MKKWILFWIVALLELGAMAQHQHQFSMYAAPFVSGRPFDGGSATGLRWVFGKNFAAVAEIAGALTSNDRRRNSFLYRTASELRWYMQPAAGRTNRIYLALHASYAGRRFRLDGSGRYVTRQTEPDSVIYFEAARVRMQQYTTALQVGWEWYIDKRFMMDAFFGFGSRNTISRHSHVVNPQVFERDSFVEIGRAIHYYNYPVARPTLRLGFSLGWQFGREVGAAKKDN